VNDFQHNAMVALANGSNEKPGGPHAAGAAPSMGNFVIKMMQGGKKK